MRSKLTEKVNAERKPTLATELRRNPLTLQHLTTADDGRRKRGREGWEVGKMGHSQSHMRCMQTTSTEAECTKEAKDSSKKWLYHEQISYETISYFKHNVRKCHNITKKNNSELRYAINIYFNNKMKQQKMLLPNKCF